MDDSNKNRQRKDRNTESSSEEERNTAARNVRLAKTGVAFASPSASERSKGLLGGPLKKASRDTSSTDHSDTGDDQTMSTEDPPGSEEGEIVENSDHKKGSRKKKRKRTSKEGRKTSQDGASGTAKAGSSRDTEVLVSC